MDFQGKLSDGFQKSKCELQVELFPKVICREKKTKTRNLFHLAAHQIHMPSIQQKNTELPSFN